MPVNSIIQEQSLNFPRSLGIFFYICVLSAISDKAIAKRQTKYVNNK